MSKVVGKNELPRKMTSNDGYRWLIQKTKPAKRWLFISITLSVLAGLLIIAQSALLALIIDHVYLHHATRHTLFLPLLILLIIFLLRPAISWLREIASCQTSVIVKTVVRKTLIEKIFSFLPHQISTLKTGTLTATLIEQIEALHGFFANYFPQMMITVILPLIILLFVFLQNWVAGLILLMTAPLIPLFMALIGVNTEKLNQENFQILSRMSAHFLDLLQGLPTLTLFYRAKEQTQSIEKISDEFRQKTMKILRIAFLSTATLELFSTISIAIIAVYLGLGLLGFLKMGFDVHITLQHALFILLLAPEFFAPLRQLGVFYHARSEAMGAAKEILKVLNESKNEGEINQCGSQALARAQRSVSDSKLITLNNIHFSYHHTLIFSNFNLCIHQNEYIALTGPSGAGKSTLLNLLSKFIFPELGEIMYDNININNIDSDLWREKITLLQQNPRLFHDTIANNIRLAKPDATDDEIKNAANYAGILEFSNHLPNKLNTLIGENNAGLSGGQIQRVALARIILKNAPIILLDEPTAHLDKNNVEVMLALLKTWRNNKTLIIATHDEKIIQQADRVINVVKTV